MKINHSLNRPYIYIHKTLHNSVSQINKFEKMRVAPMQSITRNLETHELQISKYIYNKRFLFYNIPNNSLLDVNNSNYTVIKITII